MLAVCFVISGHCAGARITVPSPPVMRTTVPPLMQTRVAPASSPTQLVVYGGGQQASVPPRPAAAGPTPLMAVQARPTANFNVPPPAPRQFPRLLFAVMLRLSNWKL